MTTIKQKVKMSDKEKFKKAELIIDYINDYYFLDIKQTNRKGTVAIARQLAFYYIRKNLKLSLPKIGMLFPSKKSRLSHLDHTTVLYGINKMEFWIENDPEFININNKIKDDIELISKFTEKEIKKHLLIKDINTKFETLNLDNLGRINTYLNKYY